MEILDYNVNAVIDGPQAEDLDYLDLSGRQKYYGQGYYGQGVTVAVVDTGVNAGHSELAGKVLAGRSFCDGIDAGNTGDDHYHGTHVAGIVAGEKCGIAPRASILPVKVLSGSGKGEEDWVIDSLRWLDKWRDEKGRRVDIVCMSLGTRRHKFTDKQFRNFQSAVRRLAQKGTLLVAASGNTCSRSRLYPGCFREVMTVGAVDHKKKLVFFSTKGSQVDVCQVGFNVLSAYSKGGYISLSGTSMSAPIVAGIAALLKSKHKALFKRPMPQDALYEMLKMNTIDLGLPGTDIEYGAGFCTLDPSNRVMKAVFTQGSADYTINGETRQAKAPAVLQDGELLVPVKAMADCVGAKFDWDDGGTSATLEIKG